MGVPALIYCAACGRAFADIAAAEGWLYGARLPGSPSLRPYFVDQDWRRPDRLAYMAALATHRPHVATVLDWEREQQLPEVLSWAEEAAQYAARVIVIPKVPGGVPKIPARIGAAEVVLGYSVPTSYGGSPLGLWEFGRRPIHLLGGSPHRQMYLSQYLNVVSCDGNMMGQQSRRGRFWRRQRGAKGHWVQLSDVGDDRREGAHFEAFRRSCREIRAAWECR